MDFSLGDVWAGDAASRVVVDDNDAADCGRVCSGYLGGTGGGHRLFEVKICEYAMRGSKRAYPTLLVSSNTNGIHAVTVVKSIVGISEGPVEHRLLKVPLCEYAMRGGKRPHPTLIVTSNIEWTYAVMVGIPVVGTSEGPEVNIAYLRSNSTNAQFEAVRGRI